MDKDNPIVPYIIVELKKAELTDGKGQLKSYCNATGAPIGVWTNGEQISYYHRKDPNFFESISDIPKATEKLSDIFNEKYTYEDLKKKDKISTERRSLRTLIKEMEDEVLANAGVDSFEEIFKLIFTKLYDELICANDKTAYLQFRNSGDTDFELKEKIQSLFDNARRKWEGVFSDDSKILLTPSHLAVCVSTLQDIKLFNNNLDVVDDAFEYLMSKAQKGEKGQFFTPRYVIDMCVKMMNPTVNDKIIDTACGSSGFTIHSIFKVWKDIRREKGLKEEEGFTVSERITEEINFVRDNVFSIDFDEKTVRVARTLNLIAGDGQTNVLHLNTLDYSRWKETAKQEDWNNTYNEGFKKLKRLQSKNCDDYSRFEFDLVMANPPFAGDIKEQQMLSNYELAKNDKGKFKKSVGRDVLFIERNLNFLKPGGRMAIVLPQGRFNNSSDKLIREFIAEHCRILAVVGLHGNVFKPHTGTKTSVLFVQKYTDEQLKHISTVMSKYETEWEVYWNDKILPLRKLKALTEEDIPDVIKTEVSVVFGCSDSEENNIDATDDEETIEAEMVDSESLLALINDIECEITEKAAKRKSFKGRASLEKLLVEKKKELASLDYTTQIAWVINDVCSVGSIKKRWLSLRATDELDYSIFFATMQKPSKDSSGEKIYVKDEDNKIVLDSHKHFIVDHDLYNHDGKTQDGIAEAFIEFAKKEGLSFFQ